MILRVTIPRRWTRALGSEGCAPAGRGLGGHLASLEVWCHLGGGTPSHTWKAVGVGGSRVAGAGVFGDSGLFTSPESGASVRRLQGGILRSPYNTRREAGRAPHELC